MMAVPPSFYVMGPLPSVRVERGAASLPHVSEFKGHPKYILSTSHRV